MLSNTFFRIKMQPQADQHGQLCLHCEHPTKSGGEPGGWMEREAMAREGGMAVITEKQAVASTAVDTSKLKTYTLEEASASMLWPAVDSAVFQMLVAWILQAASWGPWAVMPGCMLLEAASGWAVSAYVSLVPAEAEQILALDYTSQQMCNC